MARPRKRSRQSSPESSKPSKRTKLTADPPEELPEEPVAEEQQPLSPAVKEDEQDAAPAPAPQGDAALQDPVDHIHLTEARQRIQREAFSRFHTLYDAARAIAGGEWAQDFLQYGQLLDTAQVQVPISIVTEAIKWRLNRTDDDRDGAPRFFDVIDDMRIAIARHSKHDGLDTNLQTARPGRPLFFGWTYNAQDHIAITKGQQDMGNLARGMVQEDSEHRSHIFLVMIRMNEGLCEIRIYDSYRLQFRFDPVIWPNVVKEIKKVIRNIKWFPEELEDQETEDVDADPRFGPEVEVRVSRQSEDWACGLHTILNAWAVAMNLLPNPNFKVDPQDPEGFYHLATDMVNLVISRAVNSNLLYTFLVGYGYALPSKLRDQCPSFPAPTEDTFKNQFQLSQHVEDAHDIHNIGKQEGHHDLESRLLPESPLPPRKPRTAGPPRVRRPSVPRPQQARYRAGIEPAVMANSIFANSDCLSFWQHLNTSKDGPRFVQQDKFATVEAIDDFIWYICLTLDREKTRNMTTDERGAWFMAQQGMFNRALHFPVENVKPATQMSMQYLRRQLFYLRRMAAGQYITALERMQLVHEYGMVDNEAPTGIVQEYAALWSRTALAPQQPVASQVPPQQMAAQVPQQQQEKDVQDSTQQVDGQFN